MNDNQLAVDILAGDLCVSVTTVQTGSGKWKASRQHPAIYKKHCTKNRHLIWRRVKLVGKPNTRRALAEIEAKQIATDMSVPCKLTVKHNCPVYE